MGITDQQQIVLLQALEKVKWDDPTTYNVKPFEGKLIFEINRSTPGQSLDRVRNTKQYPNNDLLGNPLKQNKDKTFLSLDCDEGVVLRAEYDKSTRTYHVADLFPGKLKLREKLYASTLLEWGLVQLGGNPNDLKQIVYSCICDTSITDDPNLKSQLMASGTTTYSQVGRGDSIDKGIVKAAFYAFPNFRSNGSVLLGNGKIRITL